MRYSSPLLLIVFILIFFNSNGQLNTFIRPSVTVTTVEKNNSLITSMNQLLSNNDSYYTNRFNDIPVKNAVHSSSIAKTPRYTEYKKGDKELLKNELNRNYNNISIDNKGLSKEMISYLFDYNENSFSYEKMLELAKISASDLQKFTGLNAKDKTKIFFDISEELLGKVYILTVDVRLMETMDDYYNKEGTKSKDRSHYGYYCEADFYLTKVEWSKENANYFFQNCWFDSNTSEIEKAQNIKNYQNLNIETELLLSDRVQGYSQLAKIWANHPTYGRTMSQLFNSMPDMILGQIVNQLSEYSMDFKLSSILTNIYPSTAKIGTKEGINISERYYACEKIEKSNGEYKFKRKGVLRVKKLGDNKDNNVASELQQQGGRKLYPGMYIFENQSKYLNIVLTTNQQLSSDFINLNQYNVNFNFGPYGVTRKKKLKNRYIGLNIGFGYFSNVKYNKTDTILSSGFAVPVGLEFNREFYFTKKGNLFLFPSLAIYGTTLGLFAKTENSEVDANNNGIWDVNEFNDSRGTPMFFNTNIGVGLGLHLGPRFSLIYRPMLSYNLFVFELSPFKYLNTNNLDAKWGFDYGITKNFNNSVSLRIQF
jgi:hypothetical protein